MSRDNMVESEGASTPDSQPQSPGADEDSKIGGSRKRGSKSSKPRLTAVQKNTNHKDAENKRRGAIRDRFTDLSQLVPDAIGQERSEQVMLAKTKDFLEKAILEIRQLELIAQQRGLVIPENEKIRDSDYGGSKWKQPNLAKYEESKDKKSSKSSMAQDDAEGEFDDDD